MAKSNFIVRGGADFSGIQKEVTKTQKTLKSFESNINSTFKGISEGLGINLGKLTKIGLIAAATKKLVDFGKEAIEVASDLTEVQNVVDVTFGSMAADINEFASNATKQFGLSELSAKKFTSTMGAMLKSSGITGEAVKTMSIELTKLAADMASFYNLDPEEAFQKIRSGISGETEPLKQLGINMSVANMQAYALSQGIKKQWKEMSQAEQTLLRYSYLLSVTGDAQGDFARNAGTWANQVKLLKEQWQEFMGLIGKALIEVLLPVVKFLNRALEFLINITKEIGKIYSLITGKEIAVETNNNIADSAMDAAEGEEELASGIDKAKKAAKGALAAFDEINQLQESIGDSGGDLGKALGGLTTGQINTTISTKQVDEGPDRKKWEDFFIWFENKWRGLKELVAIPITVPAPVFAPIPNPVYKPNWNLTPPPVPQVIFPPIVYTGYNSSLESIKVKTQEGLSWLAQKYTETSTVISTGLSTAWSIIENNFNTHKVNLGTIATAIGTVIRSNISQGLTTLGNNTIVALESIQKNWQTWGANLGAIAIETVRTFASNLTSGFRTAASNTVSFANSQLESLKDWGSGVLEIAAETAKGFVANMVSGFQTVWENFNNLMAAMGEKVSGWFSANKKVITTTAIVAGVAIGAGALALAAPAAIPYVAAALGSLSAIPALKTGAITEVNNPFLAVVGDHPTQKEVVSPLDDLMGMITSAVGTAILETRLFDSQSTGGDIVIQIDGTTLARILNPYSKKENVRIGPAMITST